MEHKKNLRIIFAVLIVTFIGSTAFILDPWVWQKIGSGRPWRFGLDVAGGSYLVYEIDTSKISSSDRRSVVNGLREVIEKRVNLFGVSEPRVYTEVANQKDRLIIELAGITDVSQAIKEIGETPLLDFREVVTEENLGATSTSEEKNVNVNFIETELTGRYIKSASAAFDSISGKPYVSLEFTSDGAVIFEKVTERNVGKPLCIFLDNQINDTQNDCPIVQQKITGGRAQITGAFSFNEVKNLVQRFNAGALPAPITLVNQDTTSSELGADSLKKIVYAGILGTLAITLFMVLYYRRFGIFAVIALSMYIAFTLALFKVIPITLTLSGIAGFILSIGMAVDANILVFERTKEEMKRGLNLENAIEEGFKRAWTSIRDSNISTMISAIVLYYFTSSFVQGFALALFIGVLMSMLSAIIITRTLLRMFLYQKA